ncbi:sulfotransferase domain-containing protein [Crocinitomicaceae bacterium]|nr:sulfotransferase domain-containing protein [Crocinitomicaceae bacterium]
MHLGLSFKYLLCSIASWHIQGPKKNILLKATARGGSTWVMEMIASQPGFRFYDEPFNIRRDNVKKAGLFCSWEELQPDTCDNEKVIKFLEALKYNQYRFMSPAPFRKYYRPVTRRIVFKLHELEHLIKEISERCDCDVLYLMRHPIPNSLSRAVVPRLDSFLASDFYRERYLGERKMNEIINVARKGTRLQRFVVSWCFENYIPLKEVSLDGNKWTALSYEELLLNSRKSCRYLSESLGLEDQDRLLRSVGEPSTNISMSGQETMEIMENPDDKDRKKNLVTRWKKRVSDEAERDAMEVLLLFDIDAYKYGRFIPNAKLLRFDDTAEKLNTE